jgi:CHAT domain-containing protein
MQLSNKEVVFLSVCQTAMGDTKLVSESFRLREGFIAAGFRGAIGTGWSMTDSDGAVVAELVYSHLFRDGRVPQDEGAAEALHLAVKELKARKVPPERWIPFIHIGVYVNLNLRIRLTIMFFLSLVHECMNSCFENWLLIE